MLPAHGVKDLQLFRVQAAGSQHHVNTAVGGKRSGGHTCVGVGEFNHNLRMHGIQHRRQIGGQRHFAGGSRQNVAAISVAGSPYQRHIVSGGNGPDRFGAHTPRCAVNYYRDGSVLS